MTKSFVTKLITGENPDEGFVYDTKLWSQSKYAPYMPLEASKSGSRRSDNFCEGRSQQPELVIAMLPSRSCKHHCTRARILPTNSV